MVLFCKVSVIWFMVVGLRLVSVFGVLVVLCCYCYMVSVVSVVVVNSRIR